MRNILNFILKYSKWFVFTFYLVISLILLVDNNTYQQSVYLTSANTVTGGIYDSWSNITGYFHLKTINEQLQTANAQLQSEVLNLKNEIAELESLKTDSTQDSAVKSRYSYISANVINNNTHHPRNYFTINKGKADGILPGMGVVNQNGVVGIVNVTGDHLSRVISILNESQRFSVKLKGTSYIGSLCWKGKDPTIAYLEEIPRHAIYSIGDTVMTSGYSSTFPEDIMVGKILSRVRTQDDSFFTFKVKLSPDFKSLSSVRVINDIYKNEADSLAAIDTSL